MNRAEDARQRARRVRLMAFDVDGVLSDGALIYSDEGMELKAFNSLDGLGLKLLQSAGIEVAVITGRTTRAVDTRMRHLGIDLLFQGCHDKWATLQALLVERGMTPEDAGFMGDDWIDLKAMAGCGFSAAPLDAQDVVKRYARLVTTRAGGRGAVREVCEYLLAAQDKFDAAIAPFLPERRA